MTVSEISIYANKRTYRGQVTILNFRDDTQWFGYFDENPKGENYPSFNNKWNFVHFKKGLQQNVHEQFDGYDVDIIEIKNIYGID